MPKEMIGAFDLEGTEAEADRRTLQYQAAYNRAERTLNESGFTATHISRAAHAIAVAVIRQDDDVAVTKRDRDDND